MGTIKPHKAAGHSKHPRKDCENEQSHGDYLGSATEPPGKRLPARRNKKGAPEPVPKTPREIEIKNPDFIASAWRRMRCSANIRFRNRRGGWSIQFRCNWHPCTHQSLSSHDFGPGRASLEPVFVPRNGATDEDDGYVMCYVFDARRNSSDVVILSAQDFTGEPLAVVELPVRVPFGFHGAWFPDCP